MIDFLIAVSLVDNISDIMNDAVQVGLMPVEYNANNTLIIKSFDLDELDASDFIF